MDEIPVPVYPKDEETQSASQAESNSSPAPSSNSLKQIWCLEPGGTDQPGVLWAGHDTWRTISVE